MIYLDAPASTPLDPEVVRLMVDVLEHTYGNPASAHAVGRQAAELVDTAREHVAALAHAGPASVVFTSGATEANGLALHGLQPPSQRAGVVSCVTEHPAVLRSLDALRRQGRLVRLVRVDRQGRIDLDELADAVDDTIGLVSVMAANNETGVLADLPAIAEIAHRAGALLHSDASQLLAWGALPADHDIDLLTVSGHKMHGPQGVGALVANRQGRRALKPVQLGGGQENGLRSGTTNVAGVVGLGAAAARAQQLGPAAASRVARLRDRLQHSLEARLSMALLNGHPDHRLPGTLNIAVGDERAELDAQAVLAQAPELAASTGSACSAGALEPSPVLLAMGLSRARAASSLRLGLSRMSSDSDVDRAVALLVDAVHSVRERLNDPRAHMEVMA